MYTIPFGTFPITKNSVPINTILVKLRLAKLSVFLSRYVLFLLMGSFFGVVFVSFVVESLELTLIVKIFVNLSAINGFPKIVNFYCGICFKK